MQRSDGRAPDQLRPINIVRGFILHAEGSCLIEQGNTRVICTATVEEKVPPFRKDTGAGWITAEYAMLPRATATRGERERQRVNSRSLEIQRLIGRALRAVVNLEALGERTITIDCDVIQADGGTRTAAITGGFVALYDALRFMQAQKMLQGNRLPLLDLVAAVSVGIVNDVELLDLNYQEDFMASVDMNVVMTGRGLFVEVQGTAEQLPFTRRRLDNLLNLAAKGIQELIAAQKKALGLET